MLEESGVVVVLFFSCQYVLCNGQTGKHCMYTKAYMFAHTANLFEILK